MSQTYYQQQPAMPTQQVSQQSYAAPQQYAPQQYYAADATHTQAVEPKHINEDPSLYKYGEVPAPATGVNSWLDFSNAGYVKGLVLGAGATLLLTNPTVQKAVVRSTVKLWSFIQGGVEEVKEQFHDIKAEMGQEE
ncbi:MAG: hypothetical protein CSA21_05730 [Deltaproteobacteria bacterium]|nr:MAG: hypothetical protein CSA21_05730 [Deltaproteobacteria bacterium]